MATGGALNQTPAPAQPADIVENPNLVNYYNALDATYEILKLEKDGMRRMKVEEFKAFADSVISQFEEPDVTAQAPAPTPMPPPMAAAPPPMGPPPGPEPGGGLPGPVPSVPAMMTPPPAA